MDTPGAGPRRATPALDHEVAQELQRALEQIRHGSVTLIVQDGRVVQIDTTHKLRLPTRRAAAEPHSP